MSGEKASAFLRDHWPIIVGVILAAAAWGTSTAQITVIGNVQQQQLKGQVRVETKLDQLTEGLATAKANNATTAVDIADLRVRLHALEARR